MDNCHKKVGAVAAAPGLRENQLRCYDAYRCLAFLLYAGYSGICQPLILSPENDMYKIIYLLTNTVTGMQDVGLSGQSLDARFSGHVSAANTGELSMIANAIRTYGVQAFTRQVLRIGVRFADLDTVERNYIKQYGTLNLYGYNEKLP